MQIQGLSAHYQCGSVARGCVSSQILVNIPISRHMCHTIVWLCVVVCYSPYRAIADFSNFCDVCALESSHDRKPCLGLRYCLDKSAKLFDHTCALCNIPHHLEKCQSHHYDTVV
jgi:hypothetical protein